MTRTPPDDTPWDRLARQFAGELPEHEQAELDRWIAAAPDRSQLVEELRRLWTEAGEIREPWDSEAMLARIKQAPSGPARVIRFPAYYRAEADPVWRRALRVGLRVAVIAGVIAAGTTVWRSGAMMPTSPAVTEVSTPRGQRAALHLADGTEVVLGPGSRLRYAIARDRGPRSVHLEGLAYFIVAHDERRPFTVSTARGVATDLGTRFMVQAYPDDSAAAVVVSDGLVSLRAPVDSVHPRFDSLLLAPGDRGVVNMAGGLSATRGIDPRGSLAWTEGRLEFHETPMVEVALALGRWYDLDVRLANPALGARRLSASFKNESVAEVLQLVGASLSVRVQRRGGIVTIGTP
jgi:transmembrane sensor